MTWSCLPQIPPLLHMFVSIFYLFTRKWFSLRSTKYLLFLCNAPIVLGYSQILRQWWGETRLCRGGEWSQDSQSFLQYWGTTFVLNNLAMILYKCRYLTWLFIYSWIEYRLIFIYNFVYYNLLSRKCQEHTIWTWQKVELY